MSTPSSFMSSRCRALRRGAACFTLVAFASSTVAPSLALAQSATGGRVPGQAPALGVREVSVVEDAAEPPPREAADLRDTVAAVPGREQADLKDEVAGPPRRQSADLRDQAANLPPGQSRTADGLAALVPPEPDGPVVQAFTPGQKSGVTSQAISAPQGSGKIDGMGESFSAQLSTGIATFSVPFAIPAARGGAQASLGLAYSSANGSGPAGMGWGVGVPFIARQTDRGLPSYDDRKSFHPGQDRFVFNGGQELVPLCTVSNSLACTCEAESGGGCLGGATPGEVMPPWSAGHQYFRARVEGGFLRFFWSPDHRTWRVQDKSGVTMELGVPLDGSNDTTALELNPDAKREIYKWHLARQYDTYGDANPPAPGALPAPVNVVVYRYKKDGGQAYLTDIFHTTPVAAPATTDVNLFAHHVRLKYETRPDPTFSYRSGFLLEQNLRLKRVDVASKPFDGDETDPRHLLRRYHLSYDAAHHVSLLASVEVEGRCGTGGATDPNGPVAEASGVVESNGALPERSECPRLPPMTFGYTHVTPFSTSGVPEIVDLAGYEGFDERIRELAASPPHSLTENKSTLFDVDSDALPDVLVTSPGTYGPVHGVFFNSASGRVDRFGPAVSMGMRGVLGAGPGTLQLSNLNVVPLDLDGDMTADLLHMPAAKKYAIYTPALISGAWTWVGRAVDTASRQNVKIAFDRNALETRVVDVNFDGLVDVVVSSGKELQTFYSLGRLPGGDGQFGQGTRTGAATATLSIDPVRTCLPASGSPVHFSDKDIHLADMNGDGIADIVRLRRGDIRYWPGRGNGVWGTGRRDDCPENSFANDREITMSESPAYSDIEGTSLRIDDVNGDGLDDLVQVRYTDVDVWLNVDGKSWTRRHMVRDTPASPSFADRVHLVDINGSGTRDILWGAAGAYRYIDLGGGQKPLLLSRVENGLGKSTELEYSTSTEEMLAAAANGGKCDAAAKPWSSPWCTKMPVVAHVVKRVTEGDNLQVAGQSPAVYVTEYDYRDPVFEGRQREFRGFRKARARRLGDANSPTDITESTFLLGECKDETDDDVDDCAVSERFRDNPREALKGLPSVTERYDEKGTYLSTEASTYRLRRLYTGLDGREVRHAFESGKRTILYDTALGAASSSSTTSQPLVELELAPGVFDPVSGDPLALPATAEVDETATVPVRQPSGRAELATRAVVDVFGNRVVAAAQGCVAGGACPGAEPGLAPDETIFSYTLPIRPSGEQTGWLYRTGRSFVKGSANTELRKDTTTSYTPEGDPEFVDVALSGVVALERAVTSSLPSGGSQNGTLRVASRSYSQFGTLFQESGANGRCRALTYDPTYGALVTTEAVHRDGSGTCADIDPLLTDASYDRGLAAPTLTTNVQRIATYVDYDAFGRLSELRRAADASSTRPTLPSVHVEYYLPSGDDPPHHSVIRTLTQDGPTAADADYLETFAYIDGMGRTRATLAEAETAGQWIAGSLEQYDAKGAVSRKYLPRYTSEDPAAFAFSSTPDTPYGTQRYDAFGRQLQTFDVDGTVTLQSRYHALSTDLFDAADLEPGPHQNTPATTRKDGHGRDISTTERLHVGPSLEERHTRTQYLSTGEPEAITRVRGSGTDLVTRWMRYDTLGRLLLNVEPNTTQNFDADPATDPTPGVNGLKAWRYAYNDAGDLIATSDARGCGQNFYYDGAGRLIAEDYAPCEPHHDTYSAPNVATGAGVEVLYVYDAVAATLLPTFTRPPSYAPASTLLRGQLAAVFSRGSVAFTTYDHLGRTVRTDVRIAKPNPNTQGLADRYATRWYSKDFAYDAADREIATTTGATASALQGTAQTAYGFPSARASSVVTTSYTPRGTVDQIAGSYGPLVASVQRTADGLIKQIVYGDVAGTTTAYEYDNRRRVRSVQTYRGEPSLWQSPPTGYQPPPAPGGTTSFQLLLQDEDYTYDVVNNPTEIRDWRIPDEWPAGAKPVTRKIQYDDLYRIKRLDYEYVSGDDTWTSPFAAELAGSSDPRRAPPSPHVSFAKRILWQTYNYDWLGNTSKTDDDAQGFYDRSLGTVTNDTANDKPYQLRAATNQSGGGTRTGAAGARYDAAGNLTRLDVERNGTCLGSKCSHRLDYQWDEVGRLVRARRWDVVPVSLTTPDAPLPTATPDADLEYAYDASDDRVLKTAHAGSSASHTLYVFDSLELRRTDHANGDYTATTGSGTELTESEVPYLFGHGLRLARVVYEQVNDGEPRMTSGAGRQHVFFELGDHLGSTSVVLDKATSELVERGAFQAFGAKESDYRAARWKGFREDYGFTGKEEDVEVGLAYFGKRFLSPYLGRWVSADPLGVHAPGEADLNLYAYVTGWLLKAVDPLGLDGTMKVNTMPEGLPDSMRQAAESGEAVLRWTSVSAPGGTGGVHRVSDAEVGEASRMTGSTIYEYDKNATFSYAEGLEFERIQSEAAGGNGRFSWMQPSIASEHVWTPDDSGLRDLGGMVGTTAAGSIPGVGEVMDLAVLTDPESSGLEKTAAGVSLGANVLTAGVLPNAGSLIKSVPDDALRSASGAAGTGRRAGRAFTEPTLPGKTIANEGEVSVSHYYRSGDHPPAHAHVTGGGKPVRIGPNGKPLAGEPNLSGAQQATVDAHKSAIRKAVNKIGRWLKFQETK